MLNRLSQKRLVVQDVNGEYFSLSPINIADRAYLFQMLEEIQNTINNYPDEKKELQFSDLYDSEPFLRHLCLEAVKIAGVDPTKISLNTLYCLLFPFVDEEEDRFHEQGLLISMNFSPRVFTISEDKEGEKTAGKTLANMLGSLWMSTDSITDAMEMMQNIPADELMEVLETRAGIQKEQNKTPEEKGKEQGKAARDKYKQILDERRARMELFRKKNEKDKAKSKSNPEESKPDSKPKTDAT